VGTLDTDEEAPDPPGVSVPGLGRLQLPRTRDERERPTSADPVVLRAGGGETRTALELIATRTAARVNEVEGLRTDGPEPQVSPANGADGGGDATERAASDRDRSDRNPDTP